MKVSDVCLIVVTLEVDAKKLLFLLLSEDGSVNRQGSGTMGNKNPDLFIGVTDPSLLPPPTLFGVDQRPLARPASRLRSKLNMTGSRAVLWDMDGTLVDSAEYHWRAWRDTMARTPRIINLLF